MPAKGEHNSAAVRRRIREGLARMDAEKWALRNLAISQTLRAKGITPQKTKAEAEARKQRAA